MKTVSLRSLVREPIKVKRMTRAGKAVQVTDNGKPLWILHPAEGANSDKSGDAKIDEMLDELLQAKPSKISLSKLVIESRR
jgi:hypothetical protein